ncbi:MAG: UDP-3-O-acyl-N-acetylglucosamine deacetylase [Pseudomonadota bacterium]
MIEQGQMVPRGTQTTLRRPVAFSGIGLHSGRPVRLRILPASAEYGIWFKRRDLVAGDPLIAACYDNVADTTLNTSIANADGVAVGTVEHLMSALSGLGVNNALIEVDGPEVPILDGSAAPFVQAFLGAGLTSLAAPARHLRILAPVEVQDGAARARLEPAAAFELSFSIDFPEAAIGAQHRRVRVTPTRYRAEIADSRTFCRAWEVDALRTRGLALGGGLENAVVVDGARVLNADGFRHGDECVRHKILDAIGDLALAGAPLLGRYVGVRAGHALNNRLLHAVFATPGAWVMETADAAQEAWIAA